MNIAQQFCQCLRYDGYTRDDESTLWVCRLCGLPSYLHYAAVVRRDSSIATTPGYGLTSTRAVATRRT